MRSSDSQGFDVCVERLLSVYKDAAVLTDKEGRTALHCAAVGGSSEAIERFMSAGANIYRKDRNGRTALHMAAACAQQNAVLTLLQFGAQVNALDTNDCTPLHLAAAAGAADKDGRVLEEPVSYTHLTLPTILLV